MSALLRDLRFAVRALARDRVLAIVSIACLGLGIGATVTIWTATRALVIHPLPTPDATGLVMIAERPPRDPSNPFFESISPANLVDWTRMSRSFESVAAYAWWDVNLTGIDEPERVSGFHTTPEFFRMMGERPLLGRSFTAAEGAPGAAPTVVLSHALWTRRFAADPSVIGRVVRLNDVPHRIIGVMPKTYIFPVGAELWGPFSLTGARALERNARSIRAFARLRPGVSIEDARAEANVIASRLAAQYPGEDAGWGMQVQPAEKFYARNTRTYLALMLGAVIFVLLIACANVANLLLARAVTRSRELSVRVALGASRAQIARQLVAESVVLAIAGSAIGVLLALWGTLLFRTSLPAEQVKFNPGWNGIAVDRHALLAAVVIAIITSLIIGVLPALVASRADPHLALKEGGRGGGASGARHRVRSALVVAELALALTLLVGAGLTMRSFVGLMQANLGYDAEHALTMTLTLPTARYEKDSLVVRFHSTLLDRVRELPGVRGAALVNALPAAWEWEDERIVLEGQPTPRRTDDVPQTKSMVVSEGYFATMKITLRAGRDFTRDDAAGRPHVAIVSEAFARRFWPGRDALGMRLTTLGDTTLTTVIGIAADVRDNPNLGQPLGAPLIYTSVRQFPWHTMTFVARTDGEPAAILKPIQAVIARLDPALAPGDVLPLTRVVRTSLSPQRITAAILFVFAAIALVLAVAGIYGIMSFTVSQRTHEIGVRMALGAMRRDVVRRVLRQAARLAVAGIGIGAVGSMVLARALTPILHGVSTADPLTFALVVVALAGAVLLGAFIPAHRASRVDPAVALRRD